MPRAGDQLPAAPGEIERTGDGGVTWRTLWHGRLSFDSLAVKGDVIVAEGMKLPETGAVWRQRGNVPNGPRVLLISDDGGRTWAKRTGLRIPADANLQLLTPRAWLTFRPYLLDYEQARLLRSDDGGLSWRRLPVPAGAQVVRFVTPSLGLASASSRFCPGAAFDPKDFPGMQLWRTADGGLTWRAVRGTCGAESSDADIDAVNPKLIFVVQSGSDREGTSLLRRSTDGGQTWKTIFRDPTSGAFNVHFADARHGFLEEDLGRHLPYFGYELLASTSDGGRTWTRHGVPADLPITYYGRDVWIGHDLSGVIWHTANGGKSWRLTTAARFLDPGGPDLLEPHDPTLAGSGRLVIDTGAGPAVSSDGGRTWAPARWPADRAVATAERTNAWVVQAETVDKNSARVVTPTGSRELRLPRGFTFLASIAFTSGRNGAIGSDQGPARKAVYVTHNGGRSWRVVRPPAELSYFRPILGPGVIVFVGDRRIFVSVNEGRNWHPLTLAWKKKPFFDCAVARPSSLAIWITCNDLFGNRTVIFRSSDGGRTWLRRAARHLYLAGFLATSTSEAWATTQRDFYTGASATALWHTTDGGANWRQVWVTLKPEAQAVEIDCAISMSGVIHARYPRCR